MPKVVQTAGRNILGEIAPEFARVNDDILFGEVWNRQEKLSLHDKSMVTIAAVMGSACVDDNLRSHLIRGKENGITRDEIGELVTQVSFYAGWPRAWSALRMALEVWDDESIDLKAKPSEANMVFPIGDENVGYNVYFTGTSYLYSVCPSPIPINNVTFEPGCRNNWHIHHADKGGGQILVCVYGEGWYQEEGKVPVEMKPGDAVVIPPNVKHWHGAKADRWFSHLAIEVAGENTSNEWLEPVSDDHYNSLR